MRCVVTGATSFIGCAVVKELIKRGHQVAAVVRPGSKNLGVLDALREQYEVREPREPGKTQEPGLQCESGKTCEPGMQCESRKTCEPEKQCGLEKRCEPGKLCEPGMQCESGKRLWILPMRLDQLDHLADVLPGSWDFFFHFGWDGAGSENRKNRTVQQKNVTDAYLALLGARSLGCRRFLFSGSQAEYGVCQDAMTENHALKPVSEYGKAKVEVYRKLSAQCKAWKQEAEQREIWKQETGRCEAWKQENGQQQGTSVLSYGRTRGRGEQAVEYIHARIFSIYGPGDHPWSLVNSCLTTFRAGGHMELGACTQLWNFLYLDDLVKGLLALMFVPEPSLEASGKNMCNMTEAVHSQVGAAADGVHNQVRDAADGVYNLAGNAADTRPLRQYVEAMYELCGQQGSFSYGSLPPNAEGPANLIPDIRKITRDTGWAPKVSFEEGIRRLLEQIP